MEPSRFRPYFREASSEQQTGRWRAALTGLRTIRLDSELYRRPDPRQRDNLTQRAGAKPDDSARQTKCTSLASIGKPMRFALYQPDIPQNTGAILRLGACLAMPVEIIEPCGFVLDDRRLRRVAMDYGGLAEMRRHRSWAAFCETMAAESRRLVLLTTRAAQAHTRFGFDPADVLLLGRESAGVPAAVHAACPVQVRVPIAARSLNVAIAAAMVAGEALRQLDAFPTASAAPSEGKGIR
ncbi:MAG: tRNA (cytidine(34)-2'-O)-methyltransferase [Alphaproteobacteria bacterium]